MSISSNAWQSSPVRLPPPLQGVSISTEEIHEILGHLIPQCRIRSIRSLENGASFNNRLYFLEVELPTCCRIIGLNKFDGTNLVLKLSGRFWGPAKIQNEVSSMHLLHTTAPRIPIPELIAWSDDGKSVISMVQSDNRYTVPSKSSLPGKTSSSTHTGWILMTALPGKPLADFKLQEDIFVDIAQQLADYVALWRQTIPASPYCGNIGYSLSSRRCEVREPMDSESIDETHIWDQTFTLGTSLVDLGMDLAKPITSLHEFLVLKLEARLKVLNENDVFISNRGLTDIITKAIDSVSDQLSILSGGNQLDRFVFTHTDLSPRNILVSEDPLQITGILDFEFSGFFPVLEEYQGNWGEDDGDWPKFAYRAFLERLDKNGIATPLKGDMKRLWEKLYVFFILETYIAPWWLEQRGAGDVSSELAHASRHVRAAVHKICPSMETLLALEQLQFVGPPFL